MPLASESGSALPLTLAVLLSLTVLATAVAAVGELVAARIQANAAANSLAVLAAGAALAGADPCQRAAALSPQSLLSCEDTGTEIGLSIEWPLSGQVARRISGHVLGEARVGYGMRAD